jgi:predicted permease
VVAQTALAVVLLTGGGVMIRSVAGLASQDLGFATENVLTLRLSPPESRYPSEEELRAFYAQVLEGVGSVQGVEHAGAIHTPPLGGSNWSGSWWLEGEEDPAADPGRPARFDYISPGYLEAMRIGVVDGRAFGTADGPDAPHVAMVNESFVERFLEGRDPVGLRLRGTSVTLTVVGVVKDHLERGIDRPPEPTLFFPLAQHSVRERTLVMSTAGEPGAFAEAVQQAVWAVDADQSIHQIRTMREWVDYRVGGFLILAQIMGVFAAVALALGAVGIYGVTAYAVSQRTSEIGVRLALGAERGALVRMVLRRSLLRAGAGLALGLVLALVLTGAMTGILVGVGPRDPATVVGVVVTLSIVSFLGAWLPARRASAVDPVRALAAE